MHLAPREVDHLLLHQVGALAQKRLARGLRLNHPEAVALISTVILEFIRDGKHTVAQLMNLGKSLLGHRQVLPHISSMIHEVQVEGTFPDGTKLVTIHEPICAEDGDLSLALYGSFLPVPSLDAFQIIEEASEVDDFQPGQFLVRDDQSIILNANRKVKNVTITNMGDRPIQVGSHYHIVEANPKLSFNRLASIGYRLNIPAGTAIRFEPGDSKDVQLCEIGGRKCVYGGNNLINGPVSQVALDQLRIKLDQNKFLNQADDAPITLSESDRQLLPNSTHQISRKDYNAMFGPTAGDKIHLGDTGLVAMIEHDHAASSYGDECKFGGGKSIRDGMAQTASSFPQSQVLDLVVTNAVVIDWSGIYKADIGVKNGLITGIGKAGNPDTMDHVTENMIIGANTEVIAGECLIVTAGGIDTHIHYISSQQIMEALSSGITTMYGGGTGPAAGTNATTCTPAPTYIRMMLSALDEFPLNFGLSGKGNSCDPKSLQDQIDAGVCGLKLHEDWGSTPAAIDACLTIVDQNDIQVSIHTDTLNESCFVEGTIAALKGRTIHAYHTEGAGGGHAPDILRVCGLDNVIPSSTNPTRPYTINTVDEHLDMMMVCHHLDKSIPEDIAFADSRIRAETIGAEDILQDVGAISIISSDSQAMGRVGEVITRTWQTASKMKKCRKELEEDAGKGHDNFRIKRYVAKYTINPAIAHGMSHVIGSIEVGKLADLVLWKPSLFGAKPEMIVKGGSIVSAQMGNANASIPTPEPIVMRPQFGSYGKAISATTCITFVSRSSLKHGELDKLQLRKRVEAVNGCRSVRKSSMKFNDALPELVVDPETFQVSMDGHVLSVEPAKTLPLTSRYFLF